MTIDIGITQKPLNKTFMKPNMMRQNNNPDNSSILEQIGELKSQFTEMQTQQQN